MTHVSGSEGEDDQESQEHDRSARGKSPFEQVVDVSKRALTSATSFYMRPRSTEPADTSAANTTLNGRDSSYDYASEELEYQETMQQKLAREQQEQSASKRSAPNHKRNRMAVDNKAYQPSQSDIDADSDDVSDEGRKRRRKIKKKDLGGGPLTTLPVAGYDKRRKKKRGSKTNVDGEEDDSSSESEQVRVNILILVSLLITFHSALQLSMRRPPAPCPRLQGPRYLADLSLPIPMIQLISKWGLTPFLRWMNLQLWTASPTCLTSHHDHSRSEVF